MGACSCHAVGSHVYANTKTGTQVDDGATIEPCMVAGVQFGKGSRFERKTVLKARPTCPLIDALFMRAGLCLILVFAF